VKYEVEIAEIALKQYKKIDQPHKNKIIEKIDALSELGLKASNIKALTGEFKGLYRVRVGNYRIIFNIIENKITILSILHRKDVYR